MFTSSQIKGQGWFPAFSVLQALVILRNTLIHLSHSDDLHPHAQVAFLLPPQLSKHQPEEWLLILICFIYNKQWCNYLAWWTRQTGHQSSEFLEKFQHLMCLGNHSCCVGLNTSRTINGVWEVTQKEHTRRSGGSEEEGGGAAQRVRLGWKLHLMKEKRWLFKRVTWGWTHWRRAEEEEERRHCKYGMIVKS